MGGGVWTVILRIYFLNRKSPLLLTQNAKRVKKSKNINDAERIVWYNKGGQKGAG
jgi:hypothetical protein